MNALPDVEIVLADQRPLIPAAVQALLRQTDWANERPLDGIETMLAGSLCIGAWQGDQLVGFARVLTDEVYRALIEDVVVEESLRGQGIGAKILRVLLARLAHVDLIVLATSDERVPFYERLGFTHSKNNNLERRRPD